MNTIEFFKGRNYRLGLVMIFVGLFWILDHLAVLEFQDVLRIYTIPVLCGYIGVSLLMRKKLAFGLGLCTVAVITLLQNLQVLTVDVTGLIVPGCLVLAGVYIICKPRKNV